MPAGSRALPPWARRLFGPRAQIVAAILGYAGLRAGLAFSPENFDASKHLGSGWTVTNTLDPTGVSGFLGYHAHGVSSGVRTLTNGSTTAPFATNYTNETNLHNGLNAQFGVAYSSAHNHAWIIRAFDKLSTLNPHTAWSVVVAHAAAVPSVYPFVDAPPVPWYQPAPQQAPLPHPLLNPIGTPQQLPGRAPWRSPARSPWSMPGQHREAGNRAPETAPGRGLVPEVTLQAGQAPQVRFKPSEPRQPPKAGEKEKKGSTSKGVAGLASAAWALTEFKDVVDALHDALPKHRQVKKRGDTRFGGRGEHPDMWRKMAALRDHWDELDVSDAIGNLVVNHVSDWAIGKVSGAAQKALTKGFGASSGSTVNWG